MTPQRRFPIGYLALLTLALSVSLPVNAAQPGATGALQIPLWGTESPGATLRSVRIEVLAAPSWLEIRPASPLGPVDIRPDERFVFRLEYRLGASMPTPPAEAELRFAIRSNSADVSPDAVWTLRTDNGFATFSGECVDSRGVMCGRFRSPDRTPPRTALMFDGPSFPSAEARTYLSTSTALILRGEDIAGANEEVAGLFFTGRSVNQPVFGVSEMAITTTPFRLEEGPYLLFFGSRDKAANSEEVRTARVDVDGTAPESMLAVTPPPVVFGEEVLLGSRSELLFISSDPISNEVASGVRETRLAVNGSSFTTVVGTFSLAGPDGPKGLLWFSRDNVLNAEPVQSTTVVLDATPPSVSFSCPAPDSSAFCRIFDAAVSLRGAVRDPHLAAWRLEYAPGQAATSGFVLVSSGTTDIDGPLATLDASALSGFITLRLSAEDAVGNTSVQTVGAFAGDPARVFTLGGRKAFEKPSGLAVDSSSRIYVADAGRDRVFLYSADGSFVRAYGTDGRREAAFRQPSGVAVDAAGNVWVADTGNHRVVKLSSEGEVLTLIGRHETKRGLKRFKPGKGPGEFKRPSAIAIDTSGQAYVADTGHRRIQVLGPDGSFRRAIAMPPVLEDPEHDDEEDDDRESSRSLGVPAGVAVDGAGLVYVSDRKGRRVIVFSAAGELVRTIDSRFEQPWGVAVSRDGTCLAVSDREAGLIRRFDEKGRPLLTFKAAEKPLGLALADTLYVADAEQDQVLGFGMPVDKPVVAPGEPPGRARGPGGFHTAALASAQAPTSVLARVGRTGGAVLRSDRAGVEAPEGALDEDVELGVHPAEPSAIRTERAKGARLVEAGPAVDLAPHGLMFDRPVVLSLPYDRASRNPAVYYFDEGAGRWAALATTLDASAGLARAETSHFSVYQVLAQETGGTAPAAMPAAAADASFAFRDLYAFPNPARGGRRAVIRLQAGVADSVEVNIYDVSGERVHSGAFGPPTVLDDGNGKGPQWTYDYAWDAGGVGSGVYIFAVTAKKGGQAEVRKSGRLAVLK